MQTWWCDMWMQEHQVKMMMNTFGDKVVQMNI